MWSTREGRRSLGQFQAHLEVCSDPTPWERASGAVIHSVFRPLLDYSSTRHPASAGNVDPRDRGAKRPLSGLGSHHQFKARELQRRRVEAECCSIGGGDFASVWSVVSDGRAVVLRRGEGPAGGGQELGQRGGGRGRFSMR